MWICRCDEYSSCSRSFYSIWRCDVLDSCSRVSPAVAPVEFQDPMYSRLFRHRDDHFVPRHSTDSTASTCSSALFPPVVINQDYGASEAVTSADSLDLVHTLFFKHCADYSGPCVQFLLVFGLCRRISLGILVVPPCSSLFLVIDRLFRRFQSFYLVSIDSLRFSDALCASMLDFSSLLPGFVEFIAPPGEILVAGKMFEEHSCLDLRFELMVTYGSLPQPPDVTSILVVDGIFWRSLARHYRREGELRTHMELVSILSLFVLSPLDCFAALLVSVAVWQNLEARCVSSEGEIWLAHITQDLDLSTSLHISLDCKFLLLRHSLLQPLLSYISTYGELWLLVFQEDFVISQSLSSVYKLLIRLISALLLHIGCSSTCLMLLRKTEFLPPVHQLQKEQFFSSSWLVFEENHVFSLCFPRQGELWSASSSRLDAYGRFGAVLDIPFGSLPRPPDLFTETIPLSFFCCVHVQDESPFLPFHLEGEY